MKNVLHAVLLLCIVTAITCKKGETTNPVDSSTPGSPKSLSAPSSLMVTSVTATSISLQWTDNSTLETEFLIEESIDGSAWTLVDSVGANISARTVVGMYFPSIQYSFRVRAKLVNQFSAYSNVASGIVPFMDDQLVKVGGGTFQMGSTTGNTNQAPVHSVTVGTFYMDQYEVTYEKWTEVRTWALAHGYSSTDIVAGKNGGVPTGPNNPVTYVRWYDAVKWCNARSEKDGLEPVYYTSNDFTTVLRSDVIGPEYNSAKWSANGYRLPTEAEWEYAARGGIKSNNYTYIGSNTVNEIAWFWDTTPMGTQTVGLKKPNELKLYDMGGNVLEWCWDTYAPYPANAQTDPKNAVGGDRVFRGGCIISRAEECTPPYREYNTPDTNGYIGFRCVKK
jgi:formylglycine-generating enzyme required for sulfatase activity